MSSQLSPTCQKIATQIKALETKKQSLSKQMKQAAPGEKPIIAEEFKELNRQVTKKRKELADCIKKHPFVPSPPPKKNPCLPIKAQKEKLEDALQKEIQTAIAPLQKQLKQAAGSEKQQILNDIKEKKAEVKAKSSFPKQIIAKQKEYEECIEKAGGKQVLNATFTGTATLRTSNSKAPGPYTQSVAIGLRFSEWDHREVWITSFPEISVTYDTHSPVGTVTTTVSRVGPSGGTFNPDKQIISLSISLFFHHSADVAGDSRLHITLQNNEPMTKAGNIRVHGVSAFEDGFLDEDTCFLTVEGTISPRP